MDLLPLLDSRARRLRRIAALLAGMIAFMAWSAAPADAGKRLNRLQRGLEQVVAQPEGPPGASTLIKRGGKVRFLKAGVANVDTGATYRRNDHFRIASTSKAFSGAVALALVDRGALSLDSTIGEVLPELPSHGRPSPCGSFSSTPAGSPATRRSRGISSTSPLTSPIRSRPRSCSRSSQTTPSTSRPGRSTSTRTPTTSSSG